jgi:hypothetical protein
MRKNMSDIKKNWSSVAEIQTGRLGFGVWVGCGAGVGFLSPMYLGSIPGLGPIFSSISQNIARADMGIAGGIGHRVRAALGSLTLPGGMSVGSGCGVAIGYGIGVGMMLKPGAFRGIIPPKVIGSIKTQLMDQDENSDHHHHSNELVERLRRLEGRVAALERSSSTVIRSDPPEVGAK